MEKKEYYYNKYDRVSIGRNRAKDRQDRLLEKQKLKTEMGVSPPHSSFTYYMDYVYDSIFSCLTTKEQCNCYEAFGGLVCTGKA